MHSRDNKIVALLTMQNKKQKKNITNGKKQINNKI